MSDIILLSNIILLSIALASVGTCIACFLSAGDVAAKNARLRDENVKLRELASLVSEYISHDRCEGCVIKTACSSHELDECWMITKLHNQLRDIGMEVDE